MELLLKELAEHVALACEMVCVLCILVGAVLTIVKAVAVMATSGRVKRSVRREVWAGFAVWIILALEFALAADIVRSAIAPTWNDIGQLAAIAVIRTALNYFLEKDLEEFSPLPDAPAPVAEP